MATSTSMILTDSTYSEKDVSFFIRLVNEQFFHLGMLSIAMQ